MHWQKNTISVWIPRLKLSEGDHDILIYGTGGKVVKVYYRGQRGEGIYDIAFEGLIQSMNRKYRETFSDSMKAEYETFMRITPCPACKGQRLKKESLAVTVGGKNIFEATDMSIVKFREFIDALELTPMQQAIGAPILKEIRARISFLINVGLEYLSLSRATGTLSGGEAQRIRLATQIGSGLSVWHIFWTSRVSDFISGIICV